MSVIHQSTSNSLSDLAKQHDNTHPITKAPLIPSDLITLHYSRKEASGEIHDPISFKPFSEHSHIVTVATTGNVYLAESVKGGRDLLADISIKKSVFIFFFQYDTRLIIFRTDIITLQNPHGQPSASVPNPASTSKASAPPENKGAITNKSVPTAVTKTKAAVPCMWHRKLLSIANFPFREHLAIFYGHARRVTNLYISGSTYGHLKASMG